jgi:hypothetical protein
VNGQGIVDVVLLLSVAYALIALWRHSRQLSKLQKQLDHSGGQIHELELRLQRWFLRTLNEPASAPSDASSAPRPAREEKPAETD